MEKQMSRRVIPNRVEINPLAQTEKNAGLGCPRKEDRKLSALGNRSGQIRGGKHAVVAIRERLKSFTELAERLHAETVQILS